MIVHPAGFRDVAMELGPHVHSAFILWVGCRVKLWNVCCKNTQNNIQMYKTMHTQAPHNFLSFIRMHNCMWPKDRPTPFLQMYMQIGMNTLKKPTTYPNNHGNGAVRPSQSDFVYTPWRMFIVNYPALTHLALQCLFHHCVAATIELSYI